MSTTAEQSLTHHVRLVLDNDYGLYQARREMVAEFLNGPDAEYPHLLGDQLKDLAEQIAGTETDDNLFRLEILTTALGWVDWAEIATDYIEEERENA